jgi:hypothetical protein
MNMRPAWHAVARNTSVLAPAAAAWMRPRA